MGKRRSSGELSMAASVVNGSVVTLNNFSDDFGDKWVHNYNLIYWWFLHTGLSWRSLRWLGATRKTRKSSQLSFTTWLPTFPMEPRSNVNVGNGWQTPNTILTLRRTKLKSRWDYFTQMKYNKHIQKCNVDSAYRIDLLIRRHGKTLGRGTVDMFNDGRQQVQIYRA